ncbi:MAG: hypothetical protein AAGN82_16010 [Myxococcota bacterium]
MNKHLLLGGAALATFGLAVQNGNAAGSVSKTAGNCINAHAILMASQDGNHDR